MKNALTIDVEDYFQVSAFDSIITRADWDSIKPRVEANTDRLLQLFADNGATATFFTLGWVAQRFPALMRRIVEQGHELASHGMMHYRASEQTPDVFRQDVSDTKKLLEDLSGQPVIGYRAPSFSVTKQNVWVYDILADLGYRYSSSVYPVKHDHYGIPDAPRNLYQPHPDIVEIPMSTLQLMGKNIPVSGGGFFRLYPYPFTRWAIGRVNAHDSMPYMFYLHPWEIDPQQPQQQNIPFKTRFRHYLNLKRVEGRLTSMLRDFQWSSVADTYQLQTNTH